MTRRSDLDRGALTVVLLCGALALPWNLWFGAGIPGTDPRLFALLAVALLPVAAVLLRRRVGWAAAAPALLAVAAAVTVDAVATVRYGGTGHPPGGVGPGAWWALAAALLVPRFATRPRATSLAGYATLAAAAVSVLVNLYFRVRYATAGAAGFGTHQAAIIAIALAYAAVAFAAVALGSRWLLAEDRSAQLATVALGGSTLLAGLVVWALPVGRWIDAFHGIAQNTSTAGVGFEAYLGWAAGAALCLTPALRGSGPRVLSAAARRLLALIALWCAGSVLLRLVDLAVATLLALPHSPADTALLVAFDAVTAALALWLRINLANTALPAAAVLTAVAALTGFATARVVVGVALAPRLPAAQQAVALADPVYGNGLAHQITSTFDVVLCGLALCCLAAARAARRRPAPVVAPRIFRPRGLATLSSPQIFRGDGSGQLER